MDDDGIVFYPISGHYCTSKVGNVRGLITHAFRNDDGVIMCEIAWWQPGDSTYYTSTEPLDSVDVDD